MPTIYKIDYPNADKPLKQEVEKVGYPNPDADGETQYVNTHFEDEGNAWAALVRELEAALSVGTKNIIRLTQELNKAKDGLSSTAILLENAKAGGEAYLLSISKHA